MYSTVQEELWRVFTSYTLHADPTQPEVCKPATFVRFCKETQIVSKRLTSTHVELEISRLGRSKSDGGDYNPSITINFYDFLQLLDALSTKVYPRDPAEVAMQRIVLENVLLFASRRIPTTSFYPLNDTEAVKALTETFGKSLQHIFNHYVDKAEKRRNKLLSAEKLKLKKANSARDAGLSVNMVAVNQTSALLSNLKEIDRYQKDLICFKEYIQFCQDFNLRSTSLLTAIQVGEVFLNLVPAPHDTAYGELLLRPSSAASASYSTDLVGGVGMNYEQFCRSVLYMAFIAYREYSDAVVPPVQKLKALLLHMWKAVNASDKTARIVADSRTRVHSLTAHAGSLNFYGSGTFSDVFLNVWTKDEFSDYTSPNPHSSPSSSSSFGVGELNGLKTAGSAQSSPHKSPRNQQQQQQQQVALSTNSGEGGDGLSAAGTPAAAILNRVVSDRSSWKDSQGHRLLSKLNALPPPPQALSQSHFHPSTLLSPYSSSSIVPFRSEGVGGINNMLGTADSRQQLQQSTAGWGVAGSASYGMMGIADGDPEYAIDLAEHSAGEQSHRRTESSDSFDLLRDGEREEGESKLAYGQSEKQEQQQQQQQQGQGGGGKSAAPLLVRGRDLARLFALRPELAEFVHLEIKSMKLAEQTALLSGTPLRMT